MRPTAAMTCAGLLGLAVGHGASGKVTDLSKDKAIQFGLAAVGTLIGEPVGDVSKVQPLGQAGRSYYFLWTLERMAVIYNLELIGGKDWYTWGAELLVASQAVNGAWQGEFHQGGCDTCFALLFLRRTNVAPDLTFGEKEKVKDPGKNHDLDKKFNIIIGHDITPGIVPHGGGGKPQPPKGPTPKPPGGPPPGNLDDDEDDWLNVAQLQLPAFRLQSLNAARRLWLMS
jgi:hypothetical protein